MQIYKIFILAPLFFLSFSQAFSQTSTPTIQGPTAPTITGPSIIAPVVPSVPTIQLSTGSPDETTTTNSSEQAPSSELSSELTVTALETLNGLFTGSEESFDTAALEGLGNFSSLSDLSSLLNQELTTTSDENVIALLHEILLKLSELEEKIDNLEDTSKEN